jgi:hypothetical protein
VLSKYQTVEIDTVKKEYLDKDEKIIRTKSFIEPNPEGYEGRFINVILNSNNFKLSPTDLIDLGMSFIELGNKAADYNASHQNVLARKKKLRYFIDQKKVKYIEITHIREYRELNTTELKDQGIRYDIYTIRPVWKEGRRPEGIDADFCYDDIISFPNNEADYQNILNFYGGEEMIVWKGDFKPSPTIPNLSARIK